jgi:hypothetical protein
MDENFLKREENDINILDFIKKYPIGKGGFGKVNKNFINVIYYYNKIGLESTIQVRS